MSIFVEDGKVPVTIDGKNIIYIRPKMGFGLRQKVKGKMFRSVGKDKELTVELGVYQMSLLENNILGWEGPEFGTVSCTPHAIAKLDPGNPLVELVLKEINDRNLVKSEEEAEEGTGPNLSSEDGELSSPENGTSQ